MFRFIAVVLFAVLAAVQYGQAINMGHCAQVAIAKGVPELNIPTHDPLLIPRNLSLHLSANNSLELTKLTWANLPWWKVTSEGQVNKTSYGTFWWNNFTFSFDYQLEMGGHKFIGDIRFLYQDVTWNATWAESTKDGVRTLDFLNVNQNIGARSVKSFGFGIFSPIANNILLKFSDLFTELFDDLNLPGHLFGYKINKEWFGNSTQYNELVSWCKAHNATSDLY